MMKTKFAINARTGLPVKIIDEPFTGKYGTYEELSKMYEDLWSDYRSLSAILDTQVGRLAYQNMMLDKAREAYKYITSEDRDHE